ncbi:MAG: hypothetical protein HWD61_04610 [Parachlamydiaceae bacterium]|nr:MAG: hypothetical protein HWD61_04610 [Parachlamydiaceae bacterium]
MSFSFSNVSQNFETPKIENNQNTPFLPIEDELEKRVSELAIKNWNLGKRSIDSDNHVSGIWYEDLRVYKESSLYLKMKDSLFSWIEKEKEDCLEKKIGSSSIAILGL